DELRQGVQCRLARAPVVLRRPVARELLDHRERYALRLILDGLLLGPVRSRDASAKILQGLIGDVDVERTNLGGGLDGAAHYDLRYWKCGVGLSSSPVADVRDPTPTRRGQATAVTRTALAAVECDSQIAYRRENAIGPSGCWSFGFLVHWRRSRTA